MSNYNVLDDMNINFRESFVADEEKTEQCISNYSGYHIIAQFDNYDEAVEFCNKHNSYQGEPDVHLDCCGKGCNMSACEYAHWNGLCAYMGQFDDED